MVITAHQTKRLIGIADEHGYGWLGAMRITSEVVLVS